MRLPLFVLLLLGLPAAAQPQAYTVTYRYDAQGRLLQASYDDAFTFRYGYDPNGNLILSELREGGPVAVEEDTGLPARFALHANYPNPFNPATRIRYELPRQARVRLTVYDVLGRRLAVLVDAEQAAGRYEVAWNGRGERALAASGVYVYRLEAGDFVQTRPMVLVK
jgi:YD repeat-containing protein